MWTSTVNFRDLIQAERWNATYFEPIANTLTSKFPLVRIGEVVSESKKGRDPSDFGTELINYVGLENISQITGELVKFERRSAAKIKSRSREFRSGDVLFGRLRPELNKVLLVGDALGSGICSNEIIVLRPDHERVQPLYLRYALATDFVQDNVKKLRSGGSLPRINSKDLLDLKIPLPPLDTQAELASHLEENENRVAELRAELAERTTGALEKFQSKLS